MAESQRRIAQDAAERFEDVSRKVAEAATQQRFVREYTDTLVRNGTTLVRAVRRTADKTLRPLEERLGQRSGANAPGYQSAVAAQ